MDPFERTLATAITNGETATNHYDGAGDSAAWTTETADGSRWTRNIGDLGGDLSALQDSSTGVSLQLTDLHGNIAGTASASTGATGLANSLRADEFGTPQIGSGRFSYLGAKQRGTTLASGTILMGQRVYQPSLGRFLQTDPVAGGSATTYDYTNQDPLDQFDLSGTFSLGRLLANGIKHRFWELMGQSKRGIDRFVHRCISGSLIGALASVADALHNFKRDNERDFRRAVSRSRSAASTEARRAIGRVIAEIPGSTTFGLASACAIG